MKWVRILLPAVGVLSVAGFFWPSHVKVRRLQAEPRLWGATFYRTNFVRYLGYSRAGVWTYRTLIGLGCTDQQLFGVMWKGQHVFYRPGSVAAIWPTITLHTDCTNDIEMINDAGKVIFKSQFAEWGDRLDPSWRYFPIVGGVTNRVLRLRIEDETNCFSELVIRP